ncbi:MAG: TrkH family potassium uptake protein [Prevotella sp.]|nr:TrkH family potassium uptake protein [Prevotella sp.]MBQ1801248.1 TrkH family potassium uptake protein [Prevotella sp.]MBQ2131578.1 TrkH family potassium uptake protein [Prevotella sp.]MBQ2361915.1 TrkH family potassium uptake protein [Prevotella sp.]MBQ2494480.1 TrkH family potassium uptake protein [Prevotella sp.]
MLNMKIIHKVIGTLLFIEAAMMAGCMGMAIYLGEDDSLAFIISVILTVLGGIIFKYIGRDADNSLGRREAYLLVTLTWIIFSLFGSFPYMISGYITNFTNAYFETISGFTTTGCSIIDDVEVLPHGLLFWRTMTQWIGGLGIVFFTIAIIPSLVGGNVKVFSAEATGPIRAKMHPRLGTTAKWIWSIYSLLTIGCGVCYYLAGMGLFDCLNYAMTTTATGGFSTHNASTGYFHNPYIDYTAILFMFLSGTSFTLLYTTLFKGRIKQFFKNSEFRFYVIIVLIATTIITLFLINDNGYKVADAIRVSLFQVTSFITTTGIFNDDAAKWHHTTWVVLSICMFLGACSGSTSGGFKSIRAVMVLTILKNEIKRILHPRAVLPVKVNGNNIPYSSQVTLLAFLTAYMFLCLFTYFCMILMGVDSTNSITIALSCAGNVGPTLGLEIGPTMSWNILSDGVKWLLSGLMLMGRLEIFTVLVLFTSAFWKEN